MNKKILIRCRTNRIRDIMFVSSVAKKLKQEIGVCELHFDVNFLQTLDLLNNNPYIDNVLYKESFEEYDKVYEINENTFINNVDISAVKSLQELCDIKNTDNHFEIYTNNVTDYSIRKSISELIETNTWNSDVLKVCYVMNWEQRSYSPVSSFKNNRNISSILDKLYKENIMMLAIGLEETTSKKFPSINSCSRFSFTASMIKASDYVIGPEGCLTYMSASLGIPTIITTDFLYKKYGEDFNSLFLGPKCYYPNGKNTHLDHNLSDEEVADEILKIILNG